MTQTTKQLAPYRETKRLKASERRALIIEAAQSILLSEGFSALTLRNVAEAAGIRMATLQYYFPSREQLFQSAFQEMVDKVWAEAVEQLDEVHASDPGSRLIGFLRVMCETSSNDPVVGCFIELWAAARAHDYAAVIMRTYYDDAVALLAKLIREAQPAHSAKKSRQLAILAISMIEGFTLFNQIDSQANRRPGMSASHLYASILVMLNVGEE